MTTLIENGTIITPSENFRGSILIDGEKIASVIRGNSGGVQASERINAEGKLIFPGFIDAHTL